MEKMTIDEALSHLGTYSNTLGSRKTTQAQHEDAKRVAIDTMRKYRLIEQIVNAYVIDNPREPMFDTEDYMESIKEVVKDGGSEES